MRPIPHFVLLNENAISRRPREQKTTDVGLEPTASALGGLRATIAPTGQMLHYDKFCFAKMNNPIAKTGSALFGPLMQDKSPSGHVPAKFGSLHPFILLQIYWSFAVGSGPRCLEPYKTRACGLTLNILWANNSQHKLGHGYCDDTDVHLSTLSLRTQSVNQVNLKSIKRQLS